MEITRTITTVFMVPTLKIPKEELLGNGFVNAFIKDELAEIQYEDVVYLLFLPKNIDKFRVFLADEYERTKSLIEDYDYENGYVVVIYKLDPKLKPDFELIKQGKYSKTSTVFKDLFPKKVIVPNGLNLKREEFSLQYKIFNKTQDMIDFWENKFGMVFTKEMEVWEGFNFAKETLTADKLKQHVQ